MFVTNTTGEYTYVPGYVLIPGTPVEIPNDIYLGNEGLKEILNNLWTQDRIHVNDPDELLDFPVLPDSGEVLPENIYVDSDSIEVQSDDVTSLLGLETEGEETFGVMELHSTSGNMVKLAAFTRNDDAEPSIYVSKDTSTDGRILLLEVNGLPVFELTDDGKIAFSGRTPIAPPDLDVGSVSAADVATVLIDLGLANDAS